MLFNILFMCVFLFFNVCFLFCIFCVLVLFLRCLFPTVLQVYGPLPRDESYHITHILPVFMYIDAYICHTSYVFVLVLYRTGTIWVWSPDGVPRNLPFLISLNSRRVITPKFLTPSNT
jgi:hypothetical protein